jgi:NAD(P)-dependent dehydrogenase (short-subunit alcohol dehydrogenase family)
LALAGKGHKLILLCRNKELGQALCDEIAAVDNAFKPVLLVADLANPEQVRAAAEKVLASEEPLHMLINNAGVMNTSRMTVDVMGTEQEQMLAVNHLGHFLLTYLLLPKLLDSARQTGFTSRLVIVSSEAHAIFCKGMQFDDMTAVNGFKAFQVYGRSKLGNLLMMHSLVKKVDANLLQINALHPGAVHSNLGSNGKWYSPLLKAIIRPFFISAAKGAQTSIYLATEAVATQGEYYSKCRLHRLKPWARDDEAADRLWQYSLDALRLPAEFD